MNPLIRSMENSYIEKIKRPNIMPGDYVVVTIKIKDGKKERLQAFDGIVIAKKNNGISSNFVVRKMTLGEGIEKVFPLYSPLIENIEIKRRGDVRRAKLYYLRKLTGKKAKVKEKI